MNSTENGNQTSWKETLLSFIRRSPDKFFYNIGGLIFTCDEIFLGLLRSKGNAPNNKFKDFQKNDPRN